MKKVFNCLLLIIMSLSVFIIPTVVNAEDEEATEEVEESEEKSPVNVYVFRGEGCSHCAETLEWFEEIEEEYGDYFDLTTYEVWYDENNATLMSYVGEYTGDDVSGVPYIIVGDYTSSGFADETKDEILEEIMEQYELDESERTEIVPYVISIYGWSSSGDESSESSSSNDALVVVIFVLIVAAIVFVVIKARKD